jgi:energy-coupling factor transporter ATP-binding protein EcfA2
MRKLTLSQRWKEDPYSKNFVDHRNLSFTYPGGSEPTLKNISFSLEAGESLAIVGCNGSGKQKICAQPSKISISGTDGSGRPSHNPSQFYLMFIVLRNAT